MCDVRASVYHSLPASLADADREAEGCGQQMVAKAVCLAIAVKILPIFQKHLRAARLAAEGPASFCN